MIDKITAMENCNDNVGEKPILLTDYGDAVIENNN